MFSLCRLLLRPTIGTIILACTLRTVRTRFFDVRCRCGHGIIHPVRKMLIDHPNWTGRSIADTLVHLACGHCHRGRGKLTIHLCENAFGTGENLPGTVRAGIDWSLMLHDGGGRDLEPVRAAAGG